MITEPEPVIIHFKTRASPASCASHCYPAMLANNYRLDLESSERLLLEIEFRCDPLISILELQFGQIQVRLAFLLADATASSGKR